MVKKRQLTKLDRLKRREEKWLLGEDSYIKKFKIAIDEKDEKVADRFARLLGRYEYRLERFHKRADKVLNKLFEVKQLPEPYAEKLKTAEGNAKPYEAKLEKSFSRHVGDIKKLLKAKDWPELEKKLPELQEAVEAWIAIDRAFIEFEEGIIKTGEELAEKLFELMDKIEDTKNPADIRKLGIAIQSNGELLFDKDLKRLVNRLVKADVVPAYFQDELALVV